MKLFISTIIAALLIISCGPGPHSEYAQPVYYGPSIGLGSIIAVVVSWSRNKSILWAIIDGLLGWLYVIYALLVKAK